MKSFAWVWLFLVYTLIVSAQFTFYPANNIPVKQSAHLLLNPWAGGLNAPQFSNIDFNNDSLLDFIIFDHEGTTLIPFINTGRQDADSAWFYNPTYKKYFPSVVYHDWVLMRDINRDGIYDLMMDTTAGMSSWIGAINADSLSFDMHQPIVNSYNGFAWTNMFIGNADLPAIDDIDADGDLDVVTFGIFGQQLDFHQNRQVEEGHPSDSMVMTYVTQCWGQMAEDGITNTMYLGLACRPEDKNIESVGEYRHAGGTITTLDFEGDGDKEAVIGDVSYPNLVYVKNGGDTSFANMVGKDTIFPKYDLTVNIPNMPAGFFLDANNDGKQDMLASPYLSGSALNIGSSWFYQGIYDSIRMFEFVTDSFLQEQMIETGESSMPAFFDHNSDGLLDFVLGNYGSYDPAAGLYEPEFLLYENVGAIDSPYYNLRSRNYENIAGLGLYALSVTFGDIDADGDSDMLLGEESGKLHLLLNNPIAGVSDFTLSPGDYFSIDVGQWSKPCWYDFDGDSDLDLAVGRRDGKISYFWNFGTDSVAAYSMDSVNVFFGEINVADPYLPDAQSAPIVGALNDGSGARNFLISGSQSGWIWVWEIDPDSLRSGKLPLVSNALAGINDGQLSHPAIADFNGDAKSDLIIGNIMGGLTLYSEALLDSFKIFRGYNPNIDTTDTLNLPNFYLNPKVYISPNPADEQVRIQCALFEGGSAEMQIADVNGRLVYSRKLDAPLKSVEVNTRHWPAGCYYVSIKQNQNSAKAILILR